jgi:hypothetical protein
MIARTSLSRETETEQAPLIPAQAGIFNNTLRNMLHEIPASAGKSGA